MARIIKDRMIELRQRKGLDRKRLAKSARISLKQINRIETEADCERRRFTVERLSQALGVEPGVLTGELPMPVGEQASGMLVQETREGGESESISARVLPEEKIAYELVKHTYGIYQSDLVRMAPLLLALVAENSFAWRRKKAEESLELADKLRAVPHAGAEGKECGFLGYVYGVWRVEEAAQGELDSIEERDLLGHTLEEKEESAFNFGYDPNEGNPFVDYLRYLASEAGSPGYVDPGDITVGDEAGLPAYRVLREKLDWIAAGDPEFREALERREVRIQDIPVGFLMEERRKDEESAKRRERWKILRKLWFEGRRSGKHHPVVQKWLDMDKEFKVAMGEIKLDLEPEQASA